MTQADFLRVLVTLLVFFTDFMNPSPLKHLFSGSLLLLYIIPIAWWFFSKGGLVDPF